MKQNYDEQTLLTVNKSPRIVKDFQLNTINIFDSTPDTKQNNKLKEFEWRIIDHLPDKLYICSPIQVNNNEFVVCTSVYKHSSYCGIWGYNTYLINVGNMYIHMIIVLLIKLVSQLLHTIKINICYIYIHMIQ